MSERSCWTCRYHTISGINALGVCRWAFVKKHEAPREIPPHIVDVGCPTWEPRQRELLPAPTEPLLGH